MMEKIIEFGSARRIEVWEYQSPPADNLRQIRVLNDAGLCMSSATMTDADLDRLAIEWCKQRGIGVGHVMVEVRGGVAEFTEVTEGIEAEIVDWDCQES